MKKFNKLVFILSIGLLIIQIPNQLYSQPEDPCFCPCEEILYDINSGEFNTIWLHHELGCYFMDIILSPCGERTITGLIFNFDNMEDDPCIDRIWTIKDSENNTLWTGNPAEEAPNISPLIPIVEPCESQRFTFQFCPEIGPSGENCLGEQYNITITYITETPPPPCPPQNVSISFDEIPHVEEIVKSLDNIYNVFSYESQDIIRILEIDINGQIIKPIDIKLYDVTGKEINLLVNILNRENNISVNIHNLKNQLYFIDVLFTDGIWRKGKFIK